MSSRRDDVKIVYHSSIEVNGDNFFKQKKNLKKNIACLHTAPEKNYPTKKIYKWVNTLIFLFIYS